jgi:hypothetical protein
MTFNPVSFQVKETGFQSHVKLVVWKGNTPIRVSNIFYLIFCFSVMPSYSAGDALFSNYFSTQVIF